MLVFNLQAGLSVRHCHCGLPQFGLRCDARAAAAPSSLTMLQPHNTSLFVQMTVRQIAVLSVQEGLERLAFQNVGCSIAACRAIGELLTHAGSLAALHLHNNMSDNEGAAAIAGV